MGAETFGRLADAPILSATTRAGDLVVAATHRGVGYRSYNEDRIVLVESVDRDGAHVNLFVIDGMGGREHGDVAAQTVANELVRSLLLDEEETVAEVRAWLAHRIAIVVAKLPGENLAQRVGARIESLSDDPQTPTESLVRAAAEAIEKETLSFDPTTEEAMLRIAHVHRALAELGPADRVEIAVRRTRAHLVELGGDEPPPDACLIGALVSSAPDGRRFLDLRQMGDCRLMVVSAAGAVRFQTFGESMIPEPDLENPALTISQLMAYSLHRNIVTNSLCSRELAFKRYRRDDIPLELNNGDRVLLYSDGVDDLFAAVELAALFEHFGPIEAVRCLLEVSERRMSFVREELDCVRETLPEDEAIRAYPIVHRRFNEARLAAGAYCERYADGSEGRWMKPPKCDNTSICILEVGGARTA